MAYQRQTFIDFDENNPLCASHLEHIEDGIVGLENQLSTLTTDINTALDNAIAEQETVIGGGE